MRLVIVDWDIRLKGGDMRVVVLERIGGHGFRAIASRRAYTVGDAAAYAVQLATEYHVIPVVDIGIGRTPGEAIAYQLEVMLGPDWTPRPEPRLRHL